jgi:ParB-like chromosome segregation protein Spo0J
MSDLLHGEKRYKEVVYIITITKKDIIDDLIKALIRELEELDNINKISIINDIKLQLHKISPFKYEPVDCVLWIKNDLVIANDYNPNSVAPPEMKLLEVSITDDGYTQPIVSFKENNQYVVVDGFHRNRVGKECNLIKERIMGFLPITIINSESEDRGNRIAATIRHNRARGKHQIDKMSDIVIELKKRCWSDQKIAKKLGMEPDEVLRLCQITGLAELYKDTEFNTAWEAEKLDNYIEDIKDEK